MANEIVAPAFKIRRSSLESVIDWVTDTSPHWEGGNNIALDPIVGSNVGVIGATAEDTPGLPKVLDDSGAYEIKAEPFTLYGHAKGSPVGFVDQAQTLAVARLNANRSKGLFNALIASWGTPSLLNVPTATQSAMDAVTGYLAVEADFANNYPGAGVLLIDANDLGALNDYITEEGGALVTHAGHKVALIPNLGKQLYLVPPILGYRGEVFTSSNRGGDLLDKGKNNYYAIAEQTHMIVSAFGVGVWANWS